VFATKDGHVQITALKERQADAFFDLIGLSELLTQERFATAGARVKHAEEVAGHVAPLVAEQSTDYWLTKLDEVGVPAAAIRSFPEVVQDPQLAFRKTLADVPNPNTQEPTKAVAVGHTTDTDPPQLRNSAPLLGADTDAVLQELGYSDAEIADFGTQGVI